MSMFFLGVATAYLVVIIAMALLLWKDTHYLLVGNEINDAREQPVGEHG